MTEMNADHFVQVHVRYPRPRPTGQTGEWLWARRIGTNTAKLDNIPYFCPHLGLGDLVRFNRNGVVTMVLEHGSRSRLLQLSASSLTEEELQERYAAVQEQLQRYDIVSEIAGPCLCCVSVPEDIDDCQLALLAEQMGVQVVGIEQGHRVLEGNLDKDSDFTIDQKEKNMDSDEIKPAEPSVARPEPLAAVPTTAKASKRKRKLAPKKASGKPTPKKASKPSKKTSQYKALPAKFTVPTTARELASAVVQRLGRVQALRVQHALGALLKKAASRPTKKKLKVK
jgi:hypothetical protein